MEVVMKKIWLFVYALLSSFALQATIAESQYYIKDEKRVEVLLFKGKTDQRDRDIFERRIDQAKEQGSVGVVYEKTVMPQFFVKHGYQFDRLYRVVRDDRVCFAPIFSIDQIVQDLQNAVSCMQKNQVYCFSQSSLKDVKAAYVAEYCLNFYSRYIAMQPSSQQTNHVVQQWHLKKWLHSFRCFESNVTWWIALNRITSATNYSDRQVAMSCLREIIFTLKLLVQCDMVIALQMQLEHYDSVVVCLDVSKKSEIEKLLVDLGYKKPMHIQSFWKECKNMVVPLLMGACALLSQVEIHPVLTTCVKSIWFPKVWAAGAKLCFGYRYSF